MKSVPKLIRRFVGILFLSLLLLFALNIAAFVVVGGRQTASRSPYATADEIGRALEETEHGYVLDSAHCRDLEEDQVWAILIDNETHRVAWHTKNLPEGIPLEYSLSDISDLTLGYIRDYPTYVGDTDGGIVVLGYPKKRYWKSMWPTWDYDFIANLPKTALALFLCNVLLIFLIYIFVTGKLIKSVNPILAGIRSLTTKDRRQIHVKGVFSELALSINQAAEMLKSQEQLLAKKETARANWIAGVSHDIRTPLSMVLGYADQLREDKRLPRESRQKAAVIVKQSQRMGNLVNDLNLASKLEYNMQPVRLQRENLVAIVRQVAVDFINMDIEGRYPLEWDTEEALKLCPVQVDKDLVRRAVSNLIQNCQNHNEQGCSIHVSVRKEQGSCTVAVADDGIGAAEEEIERLNQAPHYMVCDENTEEQRHGLGLLIVKQITEAHGGSVVIGPSSWGGFQVTLSLPLER